jgi:multidrug resistance efflux pump
LKGQLLNARWNLDKTTVRAPGDGFITNVALRKGAHVAGAPVMAFIDTSTTGVAVEITQNNVRYIEPGQPVEVAFKFASGMIYTGKVKTVLQAISTGQVVASGLAATPKEIQSAPFAVAVDLDDQDFARRLPVGATGDAAIFTEHQKASRIIRKVILRQISILNYINPF